MTPKTLKSQIQDLKYKLAEELEQEESEIIENTLLCQIEQINEENEEDWRK